MAKTPPRSQDLHCFVCGPENSRGLHLKFHLSDGLCRTRFVSNSHHQGYDGWVHGGVLGAVLDDAMANWLYLQNLHAVAGRLTFRFRTPVAIGTPLQVEGRLIKRRGKVAQMAAEARDPSGQKVAEADGAYFILGEQKIRHLGGEKPSERHLEGSS